MTSFNSDVAETPHRLPFTFKLAGVALALAALAPAAHADVVFNNGGPSLAGFVNMSSNVVADDFTLAAATDVSNIRFWSLQSARGDYLGSIAWTIYGSGSDPGAVLFSGTASPALTPTGRTSGFGYAEYVFNIGTTFSLAAGSYWLGLANSPIDIDTPTDMGWSNSLTGGGATGRYLDGSTWVSALTDLAFLVEGTVKDGGGGGTVPEPGTLSLMLLALAGTVAARRKA